MGPTVWSARSNSVATTTLAATAAPCPEDVGVIVDWCADDSSVGEDDLHPDQDCRELRGEPWPIPAVEPCHSSVMGARLVTVTSGNRDRAAQTKEERCTLSSFSNVVFVRVP